MPKTNQEIAKSQFEKIQNNLLQKNMPVARNAYWEGMKKFGNAKSWSIIGGIKIEQIERAAKDLTP